ncbi:Solute carrier family 22 member 1 [Intoshia linei]|uniref:Solute carrier family 22 member 1 n=1 Tax=Intoshia linei TaxID=1819745 RepID=A0A177AS52_9BILA|nr:Solute carrier family 22 member 1 [Intoshia linei]
MDVNLSSKITYIAQKQLQHTRRYQILIYVLIAVFDCFCSNAHMNTMVFVGYTPKHRCAVNTNDTRYYSKHYNKTYETNYDLDYKCSIINDNLKSSECKYGHVYDKTPIETSIVTEWNLICKYNILPEVSQALFNFGIMSGAIMFGFLADRYGRKKIYVSCIIIQALIGACASFVQRYWEYIFLRMFVGACEQGVNIIGFTLAIELFMEKERAIFATSYSLFWSLGGVYFALLAYLLRNWRVLQFFISIPWIFSIVLLWILPESLIWLISKNRFKEADKILIFATRLYPNYSLEKNYLSNFAEMEQNRAGPSSIENGKPDIKAKKSSNIYDLFKTPNMRKVSICVSLLWFFNMSTYFGWSYHTPNLNGNVYLNYFIHQVIEALSFFMTMLLIIQYGRIKILIIFQIIAGLSCIIGVFIPKYLFSYNMRWLQLLFVIISKMGFSATAEIIYIYTPEIFPTCLRTTGKNTILMIRIIIVNNIVYTINAYLLTVIFA